MPMRYDPDTGQPRFEPDVGIEIGEGVTPEPTVITDKRKFFAGDGPPKKHVPIEKDFEEDEAAKDMLEAAIGKAKPGDADVRYASDEELAMLEQVARKVLHWPLLLGVINRLRRAEEK